MCYGAPGSADFSNRIDDVGAKVAAPGTAAAPIAFGIKNKILLEERPMARVWALTVFLTVGIVSSLNAAHAETGLPKGAKILDSGIANSWRSWRPFGPTRCS